MLKYIADKFESCCPRALEINTHYNMLSLITHPEPLTMANRFMSDINMYMTCIFMHGYSPDIIHDFHVSKRNMHGCDTRQARDLQVPYGRLDIKRNCMKLHGANMCNS